MSELGDVRTALAGALEPIALTEYPDLQVLAYRVSEPTPPTLQIIPGDLRFDVTNSRGADELELIVEAIVGLSDDVAAQLILDELMAGSGPASVKAAVELDSTLGGVVDDCRLELVDGYGEYLRADGSSVLGARFHVNMLLRGES